MQVSEASVLIIVDRSQLDGAMSEAGGGAGGAASSGGAAAGSSSGGGPAPSSGASAAGGAAAASSTPTLSRFRGLTPGLNAITAPMSNAGRNAALRGGASESMVNRAQGLGERISDFGLNMFSRTPAGRQGLDTLERLKQGTDSVRGVGRAVGEGTAEGIRGSIANVERETRSMTDGLVRAAREEGDIASPSGKARRELGKQWSAGVAKGIDEGKGNLTKAIQRNTDDALRVGVKGRAKSRSAMVSPRALMAAHAGLAARARGMTGMANMGFGQQAKRMTRSGQQVQAVPPPRPQVQRQRTQRVNRGATMAQVGMPTPTRQVSAKPTGVKNNFRGVGGSDVSTEVSLNIQRSLRRLGVV